MKRIFTTALMAVAATIGWAQREWIDVTDKFIINPRFDDNNLSGWSGTQWSSMNPKENAEHYQRTYNTYQDLTGLEAGQYRLSLDAFYRMGNSGDDYNAYKNGNYSATQHAKLYALSTNGEYEKAIAPASSAALSSSLGGATSGVGDYWDVKYIPNNMEAAYYWFAAGYYHNTLDCEVGTNGTLRIGIRKTTTINGDWTCVDNWKLEYYGEATRVTSIQLSSTSLNLVPQETADITAQVFPADATYQNVTWSSTKTSVATIDSKGHIVARSAGTCYIIATAKDEGAVTARCLVTVKTNAATAENLIINEIMASNVDMYLDPSKNYGSWVELYNPTDIGVTLSGLYVTDDPNNLKKHRLVNRYGALPAHGYAVLNFDHFEVFTPEAYRQIDDKLDCEGGTIIVSDGTNIIAQEDYPPAMSRMSYARMKDGMNDAWAWTGFPSPGYSNETNEGFAELMLPAPEVNQPTQLFEGTLQVCVNIPEGATLWYTDIYGDLPAPSNPYAKTSQTGIFTVTGNQCFRFRLYKDGYLPSPVVTRTYIYKDREYPFPIVSVVTDIDHIYSEKIGVFQKGPYGRPGNGQTEKCNWNMAWDRPVAFDFLTTDNECIVSQECDLSMCGGWSRAWEPHSFKLKSSKTYDFNNFFKAQFFDEKPYVKTKTLQIRNGGNDNYCRIKDASIQQIVARSGLNVDYQAWQPVHVFINAQHYNVLNMREANNKHFAYANYGIDTDEMDQFEITPDSGYVQMEGTNESFLRLMELSENAADEDTYEEIGKLLDLDEYVNYMAVELYVGNWDWPQNNVKGFRDKNDGKYHFVLFDLDGSFSDNDENAFTMFFNKQYYTFNALHGYDYSKNENIEGQQRYGEIQVVTLFKNLLQNDKFRKKFIDTFCIMGGSVYQPKHVSSIVNEMASYLSTDGFVNPWGTANSVISSFQSRNSRQISALRGCSYMKLSDKNAQAVSISSSVPEAKILLNDIELPYNEFNGNLFAPITLKAQAPAGFKFVGWQQQGGTTSSNIFSNDEAWKYYDGGSLDGMNWKSSSYQETNWKSGNAPIGYGKDQATSTKTTLPCYYFRKKFTLTSTPLSDEEYTLNFTVDDGAIVYVNGVEAGRYNMPSGTVYYNTFSTSYAPGNPDTGTMSISSSLFQKGENVIAVEVHNNNSTSSDILWNAELLVSKPDLSGAVLSREQEYTIPIYGSHKVMAVFEELADEDIQAESINPVRVNEVSAANSMYVNPYYFKKNDWIELYNTTGKDIDIRGMYISDNEKKPMKYQVPVDDALINTIIPAHGHKVIWCDGLANAGEDIHASFKLAKESGCVLLTTNTYTDKFEYPEHLGIQTVGRYPDGSNETYLMNIPTIGKTNQIGSYDKLYVVPEEPEPDGIRSYSKDGGITIAYVDGVVNVKSEDAPITRVGVYSTAGTKVNAAITTRSNKKFATIHVATLPKGIYIVSAITASGDENHIKFVIK